MSTSLVKGNVICKCRIHRDISNNEAIERFTANLLLSPYAGMGITAYDLTLTEDTLYIDSLRKDIVGPYDVECTDAIPKKDIKKFEVTYDGITELITIVVTIRGKEVSLSCYRENTNEDYIATTMKGLLEAGYTE